MSTLSDPRAVPPVINDAPPIKSPPILASGPLAWVRENLFRSTFDTILTIVATLVVLSLTTGIVGWAVTDANWLVITRNIRLFMVGTFPVDELWRVNLVALLCAFGIGYTVYAYLRIRAPFVAVIVAFVALMIVVPPLTDATVPPATSFLTVGNIPIASGTVTETPQTDVAFIAKSGETLSFSIAAQGEDDVSLASLSGFTDRSSAGLVNAARNRAAIQARIQELEARLRGDLLTESQREAITSDFNILTVPPPVTETYAVNTLSVNIQVLDAQTMEIVAEGQIEPGSPAFVLQLPEDGWYILRKTVVGEGEGASLVKVIGIYPLIERNLTTANEYIRVTDDFTTTEPRPRIDGTEASMLVLTDNQYQGDRSFSDYLRLSLAPFLALMARAFLPMIAVGVVGYGAGRLIGRLSPSSRRWTNRHDAVRSTIPWLWIVILIWAFVLFYGVQRFDAADLGNLLARFIWVGWMFYAGVNRDRPWGRGLLGLVIVLGLAQGAFAEGLSIERLTEGVQNAFAGDPLPAGLLNDLFGVVIWLAVGVFAARQGMARRDKYSPRNGILGAVIAGILWALLLIVAPLLLTAAASSGVITEATADNLIPIVDTRRWGGFLLTMVLTVTSILASFPIGVLLALGRRSALPVVRWSCTTVIELVRGVPFITVLYLGMLLVPLIDPTLSNVDAVIRAIIGSTLFSAAYLAENVRGGLQSIPPGQGEAARALGLSGVQVTMSITLPQALRAVIPALVGQCIALFKDTSLVALVGLTDLVGISNGVVAQAEYIGLRTEAYVFISGIYFVISYLMAYISRRIESSGSGAARRI